MIFLQIYIQFLHTLNSLPNGYKDKTMKDILVKFLFQLLKLSICKHKKQLRHWVISHI